MSEDERLAKERLERFSLEDLHAIEETEIAAGYRGLLTNEQLLKGVEIISRNAEELLEDAKLLFEHGRYARSASLAVLALEENFKKFMLFVYPLVMDDPKGRKEFWNAWRNHRVKSSTPATAPFLFGRINEERRSELTEVLDLPPVGGQTRVSEVKADQGGPHNAGSNTKLPARIQARSRPPCPLLAEQECHPDSPRAWHLGQLSTYLGQAV